MDELGLLMVDVLKTVFTDPLITLVIIFCLFHKSTRYGGLFFTAIVMIFGWNRILFGIIMLFYALIMESIQSKAEAIEREVQSVLSKTNNSKKNARPDDDPDNR